MDDTTSLGIYLRHERESRGLTLKAISESTKVSIALLEGLEGDDISRWPGGIFRRAFVRSYAESVGLDADVVWRRFEDQHRPAPPELPGTMGADDPALPHGARAVHFRAATAEPPARPAGVPMRVRYLGTAADLMVAAVLAFGSAAAGARLLWPVILIACYYAGGVLLTGTSPMVALLGEQRAPKPRITDEPEPHVPGREPRTTSAS
jgi:hypothetical protein